MTNLFLERLTRKKKQWDAFLTRLTAGKSVAMLLYCAGHKSSAILSPMSTVSAATSVRSTAATVRCSSAMAARRRMTAAKARR